MKNLFKIFVLTLMLAIFTVPAFAKVETLDFKLNRLIKSSELDKTSTVAVSIKSIKTGKSVYEYNQNKLLHPASTLKIFTAASAIDSLGYDYNFKTQIYIDKNNNLYIKLGADPKLVVKDLHILVKKLRETSHKSVNRIYIDDSIIDTQEWGTGWMWDDNTNAYMPKFSPYNIDNNLFNVNLNITESSCVDAVTTSAYPVAVINKLKVSDKDNYSIARQDWISPDVIVIEGTIASPKTIQIPVNNMRRYFIAKLNNELVLNNIKNNETEFRTALTPKDAEFLGEVVHPVDSVLLSVLKSSDNKNAETLFKVASSKKYNATGTFELSKKMFNEFYKSIEVDTSSIVIADGSGTSRNNLVTTDFMSSALLQLYFMPDFNKYKEYIAQPGEGTLATRLLDLRGSVWLKTGSISNVSGLTGYIKNKNNDEYTVAILIQSFSKSQKDVKEFENKIISEICNN